MKQSRGMSLLESGINIGVGFGISLGAQMLFLPMLGVPINHLQNLFFALIMTAVSLCRQFILRRLFEALHIRVPMSPGMLAVIAERERQKTVEGWTPEHDDIEHDGGGELARAGAAYLISAAGDPKVAKMHAWPWTDKWWKPDVMNPRRDYVRGLALGLAGLEQLDRTKKRRTA